MANDHREFVESVLSHLDRCEHGRHSLDGCNYCPGGMSAGNPFLTPGTVIGFTVHGVRIVVPEDGP